MPASQGSVTCLCRPGGCGQPHQCHLYGQAGALSRKIRVRFLKGGRTHSRLTKPRTLIKKVPPRVPLTCGSTGDPESSSDRGDHSTFTRAEISLPVGAETTWKVILPKLLKYWKEAQRKIKPICQQWVVLYQESKTPTFQGRANCAAKSRWF